MNIRPFKATLPQLSLITSPDFFFNEVRENYPDFLKSGFFTHTDDEAIYIYRYNTPKRTHLGIVAAADLDDYYNGSIVRHEHTIADKEQKMLQLTLQRQAQVKPVLLAYPESKKIDKLIHKIITTDAPHILIPFMGETHEFWKVSDEKLLDKIIKTFRKKILKSYIADGHHRVATAALLHKQQQLKKNSKNKEDEIHSYILAAFFSSNQLDIYDFNRVIDFEENFSLAAFMARLSEKFELTLVTQKPETPPQKHEINMYLDGHWFKLRWRQEILQQYQSTAELLDVALLNKEVLSDLLGITDVRTDLRVQYVEGPAGMAALEQATKTPTRVAFGLPAITIEEFIEISDAKETMPPKSTWFEPRIRNGFLVYDFETN